jgi:hypothetical protein
LGSTNVKTHNHDESLKKLRGWGAETGEISPRGTREWFEALLGDSGNALLRRGGVFDAVAGRSAGPTFEMSDIGTEYGLSSRAYERDQA